MSLFLKWAKRNAVPVITEIYRGNTPLDKAALPAPLVTLSNQETEYYDATAVTGQTYYYMWVTYNMQHASPAYSPSVAITVAQRRGVGPNSLITGNADCGYFGDVIQSDLVTPAMIQAMQNAGSAALGLSSWNHVYRKMIYKGKIVYVPSMPQFIDTWANVYKAGFAYGNLDRSKLPLAPSIDPSWTLYPQDRRITVAGDQYILRLLRGYNDDPTLAPPSDINSSTNTVTTTLDTTPAVRYENEYDSLYLPNATPVPYYQSLPNFADALAPYNGPRFGTWTQELVSSANALARGGAFDANSLNATRQGLSLYRQAATNVGAAVVIALELVEV